MDGCRRVSVRKHVVRLDPLGAHCRTCVSVRWLRVRSNFYPYLPAHTALIRGCFIPGPVDVCLKLLGCVLQTERQSSGGISGRFGHIRMCHFFLSSWALHLRTHTHTHPRANPGSDHTPRDPRCTNTRPNGTDDYTSASTQAVTNNMQIFYTLFWAGQKAGCSLAASRPKTGAPPPSCQGNSEESHAY